MSPYGGTGNEGGEEKTEINKEEEMKLSSLGAGHLE